MLSLDYRSVVRLGSVDRHFQDLHVTTGSGQKQEELLWLELFDPEEYLKVRGLFPCYGCLKILSGSVFKLFDLSDLPGFEVGGRRASNTLRDIGGRVCKHHDSGIT
jgi:hypothetical protein